MRRSLLISGLALLPLASVTAAQTASPSTSAPVQPAPVRAAVAGPQPIARAAFVAAMNSEYGNYDANKDGSVTRAELEVAAKRKAAATAAVRLQSEFTRIDTDRNRQLSYDEFAKAFGAAQTEQVDVSPLLAGFDLNKDQKITLIEYRTATLGNFDRLDVDKDGIVSVAELRAGKIVK